MRLDLVFPRFKLLSGAERLILGLAGALAEEGHEPRIVCHRFDDSCRPRLAPGVSLACTGKRLDWSSNRYLNAMADYARTWQLSSSLDPGADAHVLFGAALPLGWYRRRLVRSPVPLVYFCYEPPRVLYQDRELVLARVGPARWPLALGLWVYRGADRRLVRAVDGIGANSEFAARRIEAVYGRPATVITHGVDRERFDAARPLAEDGAGDGRLRLLTVNYLHPRKRVDLALRAQAIIVRRCRELGVEAPLLQVVGDGPERQALGELAGRLGITGDVRFAGFVADDDLPRYYWAAAAYLHTTREESFGLSVIEAAYCARPVIAVDEGGVRETVDDGVTGIRVDATPEALAAGIEKVLSRPDRGARMGEAGRQRIAARYRWERGAGDLVGLVRSVSGASAGGSRSGSGSSRSVGPDDRARPRASDESGP